MKLYGVFVTTCFFFKFIVLSYSSKKCDITLWHMSVVEHLLAKETDMTPRQKSILGKVEQMIERIIKDGGSPLINCALLNTYSYNLVPDVGSQLMELVVRESVDREDEAYINSAVDTNIDKVDHNTNSGTNGRDINSVKNDVNTNSDTVDRDTNKGKADRDTSRDKDGVDISSDKVDRDINRDKVDPDTNRDNDGVDTHTYNVDRDTNRDKDGADTNRDNDGVDTNRDKVDRDTNRDKVGRDTNIDKDGVDANSDNDGVDTNTYTVDSDINSDKYVRDTNSDKDYVDANSDNDGVDANSDNDFRDTNSDKDGVDSNGDENGVDTNSDKDGVDTNIDNDFRDTNIDKDGVDTNRDTDGVDTNRDRDDTYTDIYKDGRPTDINRDKDDTDRNKDKDGIDRKRDKDDPDTGTDKDVTGTNIDKDGINTNRDKDSTDGDRDKRDIDANRDGREPGDHDETDDHSFDNIDADDCYYLSGGDFICQPDTHGSRLESEAKSNRVVFSHDTNDQNVITFHDENTDREDENSSHDVNDNNVDQDYKNSRHVHDNNVDQDDKNSRDVQDNNVDQDDQNIRDVHDNNVDQDDQNSRDVHENNVDQDDKNSRGVQDSNVDQDDTKSRDVQDNNVDQDDKNRRDVQDNNVDQDDQSIRDVHDNNVDQDDKSGRDVQDSNVDQDDENSRDVHDNQVDQDDKNSRDVQDNNVDQDDKNSHDVHDNNVDQDDKNSRNGQDNNADQDKKNSHDALDDNADPDNKNRQGDQVKKTIMSVDDENDIEVQDRHDNYNFIDAETPQNKDENGDDAAALYNSNNIRNDRRSDNNGGVIIFYDDDEMSDEPTNSEDDNNDEKSANREKAQNINGDEIDNHRLVLPESDDKTVNDKGIYLKQHHNGDDNKANEDDSNKELNSNEISFNYRESQFDENNNEAHNIMSSIDSERSYKTKDKKLIINGGGNTVVENNEFDDIGHGEVYEEVTENVKDSFNKQNVPAILNRRDDANLQMEKIKQIFAERQSEQAAKIQNLELFLVKLENKILTQSVDKQSDSNAFVHLENQILKLENELLKLSHNYRKLQEDHDSLKAQQKNSFLELEHIRTTQRKSEYPALPDNSSNEIMMKQQTRIWELSKLIQNQSDIAEKLQSRSEYLEDQNRQLFQVLMNQTSMIASIMGKVHELGEEGLQTRIQAEDFKATLEKLKQIQLLQQPLSQKNALQDKVVQLETAATFDFATDVSKKVISPIVSKDLVTTILSTIKESPIAGSPSLMRLKKRGCSGLKGISLCLFHSLIIANCTPFNEIQWTPCKPAKDSLILELNHEGENIRQDITSNKLNPPPGEQIPNVSNYESLTFGNSETNTQQKDSSNDDNVEEKSGVLENKEMLGFPIIKENYKDETADKPNQNADEDEKEIRTVTSGDDDEELVRSGDKVEELARSGDKVEELARSDDKDDGLVRASDKDEVLVRSRDNDEVLVRSRDNDEVLVRSGDKDEELARSGDTEEILAISGDEDEILSRSGDKDKVPARSGDKDEILGRSGDKDEILGRSGDKDEILARSGATDEILARSGHKNEVPARSGDKDEILGRSGDKDEILARSSDKDEVPLRSSDKDEILARSGDKDEVPARSGDKDEILARSGDKDEILARSGDKDEVPARSGDKDEILARSGHDNEGIVRAGDDIEGLITLSNEDEVRSGHENEGIVRAGHENEGIVRAGHENEGIVRAGHENERIVRAGHENEGIVRAGHENERIVRAGHENEGIVRAGHANEGIVISGHEKERVVRGGHDNERIVRSGHENEGIVRAGQENEGIVGSDDPDGLVTSTDKNEKLVIISKSLDYYSELIQNGVIDNNNNKNEKDENAVKANNFDKSYSNKSNQIVSESEDKSIPTPDSEPHKKDTDYQSLFPVTKEMSPSTTIDKNTISSCEHREESQGCNNLLVQSSKSQISAGTAGLSVEEDSNKPRSENSRYNINLEHATHGTSDVLKAQEKLLNDREVQERKMAAGEAMKTHEALHRKVLYNPVHKDRPKDCYELYQRGQERNGFSQIFVNGMNVYVSVYCDMTNGGWTLLLRREDGLVDFYRDYKHYKEGFGASRGEHYIGNDVIHYLTNQGHYSLRADLTDWNETTKHAFYDHFWVDGEEDGFRLHLLGYSGDAGDGLGKHYGMKFSTFDVDQDLLKTEMGGNCAKRFHGAGWYFNCYASNLLGRYYPGGQIPNKLCDGVAWKPWLGPSYSLKTAVLAIRPFGVETPS